MSKLKIEQIHTNGKPFNLISLANPYPNKDLLEVRLPVVDSANKAIVIISGGLDSTILTHLLAKITDQPEANLLALSFNYNQSHKVELEKASKTCQNLGLEHKILDISFFGEIIAKVSALSSNNLVAVPDMANLAETEQPVTYVPFRNQLFATLAAGVAESNDCKSIFFGAQTGDLYGYWDCTTEFIDRFNSLIALNRKHKIQLNAPFGHLAKADEIVLGIELGVDFSNTHSCYRGVDSQGRSCGTCPTCTERLNNFKLLGLKDPLPYINEE